MRSFRIHPLRERIQPVSRLRSQFPYGLNFYGTARQVIISNQGASVQATCIEINIYIYRCSKIPEANLFQSLFTIG